VLVRNIERSSKIGTKGGVFYNGKVINNDFLDTVPFRHFVGLIFYRILESRDSIFFGIPRIQELPGNAADTTAGRNPRS
jgi:ABC-type phosphate transport system ATPase subunit